MKIRKAYKFRLKPNAIQEQQLIDIAGSCRFVWNKVLHLNLNRLQNKQRLIGYYEADFWSKLWKSSDKYGFLKVAPAHCLQQKLKDLDKAFKDGFDKSQPLKRLPTVRRLGVHDSFRFPEPTHIALENRRVKLPKLGWIGFFKSQNIQGDIRNATISRRAGHWDISLQVELELELAHHQAGHSIGIDVGIKQFATLSDGRTIAGQHTFRQWEKRLAKAQRKLSNKQKYSKNWKKQKARIQKVHSKITHIRRDFLHKISTYLSKNHAMIVVEGLKITNMSRSAKGSEQMPGHNVKAKSGLNKSILDQGWGEFKRQLKYKLDWLGGIFLEVSPRYTSLCCHMCSHTEKANRQSQSKFECMACHHKENADVNAAKNILAAGHAVLACEETGLPDSMKQEPLGTDNLVPA